MENSAKPQITNSETQGNNEILKKNPKHFVLYPFFVVSLSRNPLLAGYEILDV